MSSINVNDEARVRRFYACTTEIYIFIFINGVVLTIAGSMSSLPIPRSLLPTNNSSSLSNALGLPCVAENFKLGI